MNPNPNQQYGRPPGGNTTLGPQTGAGSGGYQLEDMPYPNVAPASTSGTGPATGPLQSTSQLGVPNMPYQRQPSPSDNLAMNQAVGLRCLCKAVSYAFPVLLLTSTLFPTSVPTTRPPKVPTTRSTLSSTTTRTSTSHTSPAAPPHHPSTTARTPRISSRTTTTTAAPSFRIAPTLTIPASRACPCSSSNHPQQEAPPQQTPQSATPGPQSGPGIRRWKTYKQGLALPKQSRPRLPRAPEPPRPQPARRA